jgi:adenylate cyclase
MERRLAAILAADVVGYSRLMEADEAWTLETIKTLRSDLIDPLIAEHHGRIVKLMGDGALVEFASAVDAVACAVHIQRNLTEQNADAPRDRRFELRIGINLGDVIVEGDDIYGDGVNVAARLETLCKPGGLALSGNVHEQVQGKLDERFKDAGEHEVKNIARPIRVWRWSEAGSAGPTVTGSGLLPDKPSIAVLPFTNMSGDPEQEYFADGITEDIITALSKIRSLFVIARNSSFVYKGQATDVRTVSASLGVRYVLEGSVRKSGGQVRITGQLIDALTGAHLWADRFQGPVIDIFELQDQVTTQVTSAVVPSIRSAEISRACRKSPRDQNAYDFYLQALAQINLSNAGAAFPLLSQARVLAPDFAPAFGLEAWCRTMWSYSSDTPDFVENSGIAVELARKALSLNDDDPELLGQIGYVLAFFEENINLGVELVRDALDTAPSLAWLWGSRGYLDMFFGDCADAVAAFETSRRLDPRDPLSYRNNLGMAQAHFMLGDYETALNLAKDALEQASENLAVLRFLAVCYAQLGDAEHAQEFVEKHMAAYPSFRIKIYFDNHPIRHAKEIDLIWQAMRKAGLPE